MYIKKLTLKNYRNYKSSEFKFINGINILVGMNAQGKTNAAEAVFYLCTGYSPRATRDKQLILNGEKSATAKIEAETRFGSVSVEAEIGEGGKDIKVNGVKIARAGELMGNVNSVFFNPGELKLIQESPEDRRRFMDVAISQMNKNYFYALQKYRKVLDQRGELLKSDDKEVIYETLPFWDEKLCEYAGVIIKERVDFIKDIKPLFYDAMASVSGGGEKVSLTHEAAYLTAADEETVGSGDGGCADIISDGLTANDYSRILYNVLRGRVDKDVKLGYTGAGPHRDDLKIKINGADVRIYGSQGQQRTASLALKLAELEIFKAKFNEYPVLILDDAFSELDKTRRERLVERVKNLQTIITVTDLDGLKLSGEKKIFYVSGGNIVDEK